MMMFIKDEVSREERFSSMRGLYYFREIARGRDDLPGSVTYMMPTSPAAAAAAATLFISAATDVFRLPR